MIGGNRNEVGFDGLYHIYKKALWFNSFAGCCHWFVSVIQNHSSGRQSTKTW